MIDLQGAEEGNLRQWIYNIHSFNATLSQVAEIIREVMPDAEITFEQDNSVAMIAAHSEVNYRMDDTVAFEGLGCKTRCHLAGMVEDFIKEVKVRRINK